ALALLLPVEGVEHVVALREREETHHDQAAQEQVLDRQARRPRWLLAAGAPPRGVSWRPDDARQQPRRSTPLIWRIPSSVPGRGAASAPARTRPRSWATMSP